VLIPAGSRIVGKISQADPSGLVNITFSSIEFPGGETVPIDAVAADMSLQAIKGKVTGKQAGKSMLVRSLSGIGETAAMIVGAPSANGAFGEDDLLRVRMADNIGNARDHADDDDATHCCERTGWHRDLRHLREIAAA